jgi:ankyrin repeat protein
MRRLLLAFAGLLLATTPNIEELHRAARSGDLKRVEALVAAGTPVNGRDTLGGTPLHDAAWAGEVEIVEYLIGAGADVNARHTERRSTPLDYAVLMNRFEVVEILLAHGALLDPVSKGNAALHRAAGAGATRIAKLLIAQGVDENTRDESGSTPIQEAAARGETAMVEMLIDKGADAKSANPLNGLTPLHVAAVKGHTEVAQVLLTAGAKIDAADKDGATPLEDALHYRQVRMIVLLIEKGAKLEIPTALHEAVMRGQADVVGLLLDRMGASGSGELLASLLHDAALKGYVEVVELLIAHKADVNARNAEGATALHDAALAGKAGVAEALLNHGAEINARDGDSEATALHRAASWGRRDMIELLVARGADRTLKDKNGKTALDLAVANGQNDVLPVLMRTP